MKKKGGGEERKKDRKEGIKKDYETGTLPRIPAV